MITSALQPHVNTADEPPIYFLGLPTILRATGATTNGAFGLVEQTMPPGNWLAACRRSTNVNAPWS